MLAAATVLIVVLASVVGAFQCRVRWARFARRRKSSLVLAAGLSVPAYACMLLTGWRFTPPFANESQRPRRRWNRSRCWQARATGICGACRRSPRLLVLDHHGFQRLISAIKSPSEVPMSVPTTGMRSSRLASPSRLLQPTTSNLPSSSCSIQTCTEPERVARKKVRTSQPLYSVEM